MTATVPWRGRPAEQFPGVPAWGAPSQHVPSGFPFTVAEQVDQDWAFGGSEGAGVRVCVVDSGVDGGHPLVGTVERSMTVVSDTDGSPLVVECPAEDTAGHGTACAGIIRGLAPQVSLSSMRVLTDAATGTGDALLAGVEWAIDEGYDVVNLSVATTRPRFELALYELADRAYFRRCTLVVSAHNMPVRSFPWPYASVISVASHDQPDPLLHYYNPAPPVEFLARGVSVPVAWTNHKVVRSTGNSYAAPHVSALCALILAKHPWLTPFQLKSVLYLTARNVATAEIGEEGAEHVLA